MKHLFILVVVVSCFLLGYFLGQKRGVNDTKKTYKISVNTPLEHCDKVRKVLGNAGAGQISGYKHCSFSVKGVGRSLPGEDTKPFIGTHEKYEEIKEERIESFCFGKDNLKRIIAALKKEHPYEEPVITVTEVRFY